MFQIRVRIDDALTQEHLKRVAEAIEDRRSLMREEARIMHGEIEANFRAGGRPTRWEVSEGAKKRGGKTLIKSGQLVGSVSEESDNSSAHVGTNKAYGPAQHFGFFGEVSVRAHMRRVKSRDVYTGKKKTTSGAEAVRAHTRKMYLPARPFMVIPESGIEKMRTLARNWLDNILDETWRKE